MTEKIYFVGELAEISGTTIRTIQYYDKIGLLKANRHENSKKRYYTKKDLIKLQQILFYKKLGVPLNNIKNYLSDIDNKEDVIKLLKRQSDTLFQKEMEIKMNIAIIEAITSIISSNNVEPDLDRMIELSLKLNKQTILEHSKVNYSKEVIDSFKDSDSRIKEMIEIYWLWKKLILEAVFLKSGHVSIDSQQLYELGEKWFNFISLASSKENEMGNVFADGLSKSNEWPEEDLLLYNYCNDFIDEAYGYYCKVRNKNNDTIK